MKVISNPPSCQLRKADREWWWVDGKKFDSTQELLDQVDVGQNSKTAHYVYQEDSELNKNPWRELPGAVAMGAAGGAVVVGGVAVAAKVIGELLFLGRLDINVSLVGAAAFGAAVGGLVATTIPLEQHQDYKEFGKVVEGELVQSYDQNGEEHVRFHPDGEVNDSIDLEEFAQAPVQSPNDGCQPWWKGRGYTPSPA